MFIIFNRGPYLKIRDTCEVKFEGKYQVFPVPSPLACGRFTLISIGLSWMCGCNRNHCGDGVSAAYVPPTYERLRLRLDSGTLIVL